MNPEIKAKWVAALRSGKYKQGESALRIDQTYCCLGVLCALYAKDYGKRWSAALSYDDPDNGRGGFPSDSVVEWAGLPQRDPHVRVQGDEPYDSTLAEQNDMGATFKEIADIIEREL